MLLDDIIFALATAPTRSALHLHRLSGPGVCTAIVPFLRHPKKPLESISPTPGRISYALIVDPHTSETIDDVVIAFFYTPHSFTGQDTVELSCHGNPLISARLQTLFRAQGWRDAKPGEFTWRAVTSGKLDFAQAEGIAQLVGAETWGGVTLARTHVEGHLSDAVTKLRQKLLEQLAYLEAHIDFAPDEVGDYEPDVEALKPLRHALEDLLDSYQRGTVLKEGLRIALVGKPNAGKSTLYNALLKAEKAIVTPIAGTTRDVLEDRLVLGGRDFVVLDTAGLRETGDIIEQEGVARSYKAAQSADVVLWVSPVAEELTEVPDFQKAYILVLSKQDEWRGPLPQQKIENGQAPLHTVCVHRGNIKPLIEVLETVYDKTICPQNPSPTLSSARQRQCVERALSYVQEAEQLLKKNAYPETIAAVLHLACHALEDIVGLVDVEDILGQLFSSFCIGK